MHGVICGNLCACLFQLLTIYLAYLILSRIQMQNKAGNVGHTQTLPASMAIGVGRGRTCTLMS